MEISKLLPVLDKNGVRLFAVGLEDFGYEEFVQGNYFKGDLYIDIDEASYKEIGYKKYGTFGVLMSLFQKTARDAISKVSNLHLGVFTELIFRNLDFPNSAKISWKFPKFSQRKNNIPKNGRWVSLILHTKQSKNVRRWLEFNFFFQSRSDGLEGNLKGNGLQTGGTLIVSENGTKILMDYRQTNPADHVQNSEILKVLGIVEDGSEQLAHEEKQ